jgi:CMP-N,N'-diacetyllegionaminic acid synthase
MKILAIIPARGGSKRLPGKNIRLLGDKPLIAWSIQSAFEIGPEICDVLVTTDNQDIAKIATDSGTLVPWLRPSELASDTASSVDVCLHALSWYEENIQEVDGVLLLQPTSPFRTIPTLLKGIEAFKNNRGYSVVGVSNAKSHPSWCFKLLNGVMIPFINGDALALRSQDLEPVYVPNGSFYLIESKVLRVEKSFYGRKIIPLIIDDVIQSIDIDTELDWIFAESALKSLSANR